MTPGEFQRVAASIPKPTVDALHVHSRQEVEALREFVDRADKDDLPPFLRWHDALGIPVYVIDDTPPGVIRAMLNGELVSEHNIR
jgi:hypothetical protein